MKRIVLVSALLLLLVGCSSVRMTPPYQQTVEMSAIRVAELNSRCQEGDDAACKDGLSAASKTLELIVDGMRGQR